MSEHEKVDHIISVNESDGVHRAACTCGWTSYVASTERGIAERQGYKHGERLYKPPITMHTRNLSLRLEVRDMTAGEVREIIQDTVKAELEGRR